MWTIEPGVFVVFGRLSACKHTSLSKSLNYKPSPGVFLVLRASWFNQPPDWWLDWRKSTASYSDLSLVERGAWMQNFHLWAHSPGIYRLRALAALTVQKRRLLLGAGDAAVWLPGWKTRPAGSLGVKTSRWSSDVSEGQISFLLPRFIRQLIKGDRSMGGDSALTPKRGKRKREIKGLYAAWKWKRWRVRHLEESM